MLTLNEIRNVNFRKSNFGGYRAEDVEAFIDEVQLSYDTLLKENAELVKKLEVLASKLEEYQNEEESIRNALMNAQKVGDASLRDAKHKAEIILKDATIKAEKIVANAQGEIHNERDIIEKMQRDVADFKTKLLRAYKDHLTLINNIPNDEVLRPETREVVDRIQMYNRRAEEPGFNNNSLASGKRGGGKQVTARRSAPPPQFQDNTQFDNRDPGFSNNRDDSRDNSRDGERMPVVFPDDAPAAPQRNAPVMPAEGSPQRRGGFTVDVDENPLDDAPASRRSRFSSNYNDDVDVPAGNFADVRVDVPENELPPTSPASLFNRR